MGKPNAWMISMYSFIQFNPIQCQLICPPFLVQYLCLFKKTSSYEKRLDRIYSTSSGSSDRLHSSEPFMLSNRLPLTLEWNFFLGIVWEFDLSTEESVEDVHTSPIPHLGVSKTQNVTHWCFHKPTSCCGLHYFRAEVHRTNVGLYLHG